jgi:hypothetical protein
MAKKQKPRRILSIDGAGIYGLMSVLWLRQLCEQDERFLSGDDEEGIDLFAGISAGAVTALMLARHERPRELLLSGELEEFWAERIGAFSNVSDPVQSWLSLWGIGGWFGEADFLGQLQRHFGDKTLADLAQPVLISTFNWLGHFEPTPGDRGEANRQNEFVTGKHHGGWQPSYFSNHDLDSSRTSSVVEVAYGAASPAGLRAIRNGHSDAGIYAVSPSVHALSSIAHLCGMTERIPRDVVAELGRNLGVIRESVERNTTPEQLWAARNLLAQSASAAEHELAPLRESIAPLASITMLSVGNGSRVSSFWLRNFNFSMQQMSVVPTNPFQGQFLPPFMSAALDALSSDEDLTCRKVLGARYHRLQASLMPLPVLLATWSSRFPFMQQVFEQWIRQMERTAPSAEAVGKALKFIGGRNWRGADTGPG